MPHDASVYINCTLESQNTPIWLINLAGGVGIAIPFDTSFNDHGLYELPGVERQGMSPILRLLINDTAVNNKTMINCYAERNVELRQTTLYVYGISCMQLPLSPKLKFVCLCRDTHINFDSRKSGY